MKYKNNENNEKLYVIDKTFKNESKNGRINIDRTYNGTPFFMKDLIQKNEKTNYFNATQHMTAPTMLSNVFFSADNIEIIQNAIRSQVYKLTEQKYIIDKQDYDQLKIIMRAIFLQYSLNRPNNIKEQVSHLNKLVLDYCIPKVHGELLSYLKYKEDISQLPVPADNPTYLSVDRTLELKNFF